VAQSLTGSRAGGPSRYGKLFGKEAPLPLYIHPMVPRRSYLFVDESGVAELGPPGDTHGQYLGLLGCVTAEREYWREIEPAFASLKKRHFPGSDPAKTVLHRSEIVGKQGVFGILKDPARRAAFDEDMLRLYGGRLSSSPNESISSYRAPSGGHAGACPAGLLSQLCSINSSPNGSHTWPRTLRKPTS
jgi:hypothetical protein